MMASAPGTRARGGTVDPVVTLLEIEAIKRLKARYFRFMDTKQWEEWGGVFTGDAVVDVTQDAGPEEGIYRGRDQIVERVKGAVGPARTAHHGHMPEIELTGPDTAKATWAMFDYVEFPTDGERAGLRGYGHYLETYRKEADGEWRIATLTLTRLRVDPL
jgi:hypothetical protein